MTWVDRDGRRYKLSEMSTGHIQNCISLIERKLPNIIGRSMRIDGKCRIKAFKDELAKRQRSGERLQISTHKIEISEADLIAFVKSQGVKIPKSGARMYVDGGRVSIQFTTEKKLKNAKA